MIGNSLSIILLFVLVIAGEQVHAEIINDPSLCSRTRCIIPSEQKFKYAEGVLYRYYHSVDVSANLGGRYHDDTEEVNEKQRSGQGEINESTLFIDSTVTLNFVSPCEGYMRITNASIRHEPVNYNREFPDRADAEFRAHLERHPLRFAFDDGHVREVCPEAGEVVWALNLKRGILSMLQNTMKRFDVDRRVNERDINGICETVYRLHEAKRTSLIIKKSKDLATCTHRGKHLSVIQSTFYRSPLSHFRHSSQPLLRSYSDCEITIDHNVYEKVVCRESHHLQPFSNGASAGARTNTVAVLRLLEESKETEEQRTYDYDDNETNDEQEEQQDNENRRPRTGITKNMINAKRTSLLYDHSASPRAVHGELRSCRDLLKSMCTLGTSEDLDQRFSEMYTKFIHSARLLDYPSMSQLLSRANSICTGGRKHIIDALPFVGSNAAVKVMIDLIKKKVIDHDTTNEWVTAFALIPRPDAATLLALMPLLDFQRQIPEAQFILSYSAVVHAYCANQEAGHCVVGLGFKYIDTFMRLMEDTIERGCAPRAHDLSEIKQTLEALKAIGNMGLETATMSKRLKSCIDNVGAFLPMEVRVSAIDAHRRLPSCPETRDRIFLNYYRNLTLDSEIRIASYLQVMRCPDYNVIKIIKHTLKHEQVNQVGSFVWSHLTNLLASSSPTRVEIQSLLTDRDLGNKFNHDLRKYSRNYEKSVFSEEWNLGANYQSNLIFSSKSYVPRSATFNVTVDLFGESVNVFEVSMRIEGMEYYVENIFGPEGPLSNEKIGNHMNQFLRSFRSARDSDDENYWGKVKRLPNVIDNNFDDPRISMSYKIFGNELGFKMLNGDNEIRSSLASLNPWTKIKQILSGKKFHYENTVMFLDSSYVVPTTTGLPVRLELAGSAACNFKFSGLLDSERLASNTELEVVGNVTPSFSIDVTGRMIVDAFYKSAGLKLRSNVYSFGAVQLHLKIKGARLVRVGLDLPNRSMEVISIRTDVLLVSTNGAETKERLVGKLLTGKKSNIQVAPVPTRIISNTSCSWPALERLIGLKLCADYQFPNVTKLSNASYFILNGPTLFKVSVIKADPTAKSYLLEYKWDVTPIESVVRLAFDTPGSQINRELSATVSFDIKNHNVTALLRSAGNSLVAKGTYKRSDDEAMIDVGLDINGTKHLDASVGYTRKRGNYGYTYTPKLYLAINSERIAELSGTIRNAQKHNVSQCDIDLSFETKKIKSRILGYIMRRNMTLTGNVKLDYQLNKSPKKETLQVEISLINRSSKTLTHKEANLKLHSTAYHQLNVVILTWYQQALGHIEVHAEINTKPHLQDNRHKLTAQLVLTHSRAYFQSQEAKINAFISITKPIQNLDIKVGVQHFAVGTASKTNFLIRYAPGKEISLAVNMVTPHGNLFAIEGHANLTIPNFNSMLIDARISERARREYDLDFSGTWFSGHNMTIRGTYADRSTTVIVSHSLKIILTSPSFRRDILLNCKLYQDATDIKINLQMEHLDLEKYALIVDHSTISPSRLVTYAEGRYKNNVYTMTTNVDTEREIRVELHLDRWRDVHISATGINEPEKKEFGIQVKWDANRDPALKFAAVVQLNKFLDDATFSKNISGTVIITYPNRLVTASCLFARQARTNHLMDTRLDWGPDKTIRLTIDTDYGMSSWPNSLKFESQLLTPFENWKKTSLNARYRQTASQVGASCSAHWQDDQCVLIDFQGDTRTSPDLLECSAHFGFTSSVHSIGWLTANLTHKQVPQRSIDSRLLVNYDPDKVIDLKSIWMIDRDAGSDSLNITGNLQLASPMANYRKGEVKCQLRVMPNWRFYGASNLDLDKRKYTAVLVGDFARLKESLLEFNVTTPLERYAFFQGRFGLSERDRHIVAEVISPSGSLGFEALCQLFTEASYDFHVKLKLATPIELLQKSLFVAKLNRREADFRVAYNNITAGFQGVWHYNNLTDFHYSYVLLTPIHGLHESGIVAKLVAARPEPLGYLDLDTEFSLRIVETKIGLRAHGRPKPPPPAIPITSKTRGEQHESDTEQEDEEEDEEDEMETFYWKGDVEINAAIIAPIVGTVDIDIEGPIHKIIGFLKLPQGRITVDDRFTMEDLFNMKNELSVDTPFLFASEITSLYVFSVDSENSIYLMEMDLNVLTSNRTIWAETGLMANYSYVEVEDDSQAHTLKLKVKTPLRNFNHVNINTIYEVDENMHKAQTTIATEDSRAVLAGTVELEEGFLEAAISAEVDSPALYIPRTKIVGKKDFTDKEKRVEFAIHLAESKAKSAEFQASWHIQDEDYVKASMSIETWIVPLRSIEAQVLYVNAISVNNSAEFRLNLKHSPEQEYRLIGDFNNGTIDLSVHSPMASYEHLHFVGDLERPQIDGQYRVNGELKNLKTSAVYAVIGSVVVGDAIKKISEIDIEVTPRNGDPDTGRVSLRFHRERNVFTLNVENYHLNGTLDLSYANDLNWDVNFKAEKRRVQSYEGDKSDKYIYEFNTYMDVQANGNTTITVRAMTPWKGIEIFSLDGNLLLENFSGHVKLNHQLNENTSHGLVSWKLAYMIDMFGRIVAGVNNRSVDARIFLKNPKKAFKNVETGFYVDVDRECWRLGTNATIGLENAENVDVVINVRLPPPNNDDHRLLLSYHANHGVQDARYVVGYNALRSKMNYASDGSIRMAPQNLDSHLRVTWGNLPSQTLNNILNMTFNQKSVDFKYSLYTPKYQTEETAIFRLNYDATPEVYSLLNADLHYPAAAKLATARISYSSLSNVNGTVNATTSIPQFSYAGCHFIVLTTLKQNRRFVEIFWPNNTALLNSDYSYHSERLDSTLEGVLQLEIPLSTRHVSHMTYGYKKRPLMTNGYAQLTYNKNEILNATYNSKGESRAGFEKERIHITVENIFKPIGIIYVNQYEYSAGNAGTNYPTVELKQVNVYGLLSNSTLKVAGESRVRTTHEGQEIYLKGVHHNRTIQLKTDYQVLSGEFDQNTLLSLAEDAWASYHINILNKTTQDVDNQFFVLNLAYPRRNFTLNGSYKVTSHDFDSEAKLTWDENTSNPRIIGTALKWKNSTDQSAVDRQEAVLSFKHPSFAKDVTFTGKLMKKDPRELINSILVLDYSTNPDKLLIISGVLLDESETSENIKYTYTIAATHPKTQLDLRVNGNVRKHGSVLVETDHRGLYKRSYLPQENGQLHGRIDANDYEIRFHRESNELIKHLNVRYYPADPAYVINGTVINTPDLNATGAFYINVPEKLTWMMLNYTDDAVESLRMYGYIPDVRNAMFDIWRTYDQDLVVNDVSFYIKLNHSRLVTSKLKWRPELRGDIYNLIKTSVSNLYDEMGKDVDYWKQYIRSESVNAISDVWEDAREDIQLFLEDLNDLKTLEQDFDDLKIYLNGSYNANDFYIKDIVAIGIYVIDELSLRSHIESLPNIINEIWEIMGESGEAIRNSLLWIIETMKNGYKKFTEIVTAVVKGEAATQIANIVEKIIEKYDMFVKDVHVSFIMYIQNLWNKFNGALSRQWNEMLKMIEPIFIRVIHYVEAVLWKVSKEVVDFLYDRRNEIIDSPYFDRFTNLTHDVDRIYRDIKANDIVTNVQKYSAIVIQFIRERYFNIVPFGKELKDLLDEIVSELKELTKLPSVNYALDKAHQVYEKAKYLYEYLGVRAKIESVVRVAHSKLMEISQSALQAESRYREAKTKFIFDPDEGLLCLEQKLPMSWHAFNQTPEFQEIPEYRSIVDMKSYFTTSNTTFWTLYYQYKPYTEPSNWLPPFRAQAMIVGSQHFITFDDRHLDFAGSCTYLLARDFIRNQFAVLIDYDRQPNTNRITHRIIVLIGSKAIELDVFKDTVKLVDTGTILQLPVELENGTAFVYQEESIVTVETKHEQFKLRCNLKYDLCILELSGYYYGKTAGLLGTMDNEPMDDTLSSDGTVLPDVGQFAQSWSLERFQCSNQQNFAVSARRGPLEFCDSLFVNKSSEFSGCFNVVSPDRYAETCVTSTDEGEVCTLAMSYMQMCSFYDTYLRIPDKCTTCPMLDGSVVPEGEFRKLDGDKVPRTTDVVFIVEAKGCNKDIRQNRSIDQLISQLSKELEEQALTDNRWSLVTFGGDGVYDRPRNLILENRIFTEDTSRFADYFSNIPTGNGNQDIFAAIGFASQLVFRAGVSKSFILMPCTHCEPENQTLDYSVLHQVLLEHDITLHILMDGDFYFKKQRVNKMFYGLDAHKSYTRKDAKALIGDVDLRRQVKLSKSALGYCAPLSLETNGTIFSGNKLRFDKPAAIKKFASVFSKRVAVSAQPSPCQHCECTADNNGITHMECMPCVYPMPVAVDYETFNEDDALALLQPLDVDYGQIDIDDE